MDISERETIGLSGVRHRKEYSTFVPPILLRPNALDLRFAFIASKVLLLTLLFCSVVSSAPPPTPTPSSAGRFKVTAGPPSLWTLALWFAAFSLALGFLYFFWCISRLARAQAHLGRTLVDSVAPSAKR